MFGPTSILPAMVSGGYPPTGTLIQATGGEQWPIVSVATSCRSGSSNLSSQDLPLRQPDPHTRSKETCGAWLADGRNGGAVKAFTVIVGALLGLAVSAVVFSFQLALSPYFGFLVLVGVGFWLNDVRKSPSGASGPNWRSFFMGAAIWIGLGVGALLYRNWLAGLPANAVSPSAVGAALLVFGIALVAVGLYAFRGSPSQRVIERWDQLDGPVPIFGLF